MDMFLNLRAEKQEHIINAALSVFGKNGYKKSSVADIAEQAGIAKGMINYYFGSKKNLYLYLADFCSKLMLSEMEAKFDRSVTDYFDRQKMSIRIKIDMIKRHPAILSFLANLYSEKDENVAEEIAMLISRGGEAREKWVHAEVDASKFNEDVDPKLLDKMIIWMAEGFVKNLENGPDVDEIESFAQDLFEYLDLIKKYFYKN